MPHLVPENSDSAHLTMSLHCLKSSTCFPYSWNRIITTWPAGLAWSSFLSVSLHGHPVFPPDVHLHSAPSTSGPLCLLIFSWKLICTYTCSSLISAWVGGAQLHIAFSALPLSQAPAPHIWSSLGKTLLPRATPHAFFIVIFSIRSSLLNWKLLQGKGHTGLDPHCAWAWDGCSVNVWHLNPDYWFISWEPSWCFSDFVKCL